MINDHTLACFGRFGDHLLKPIYADYAFANLPATLQFLLTGEATGALLPADCFGGSYPSPQKIVLIFIDGFGWQFWQRYAERSRLMQRVMSGGVLTPISALFPSTTAASVTTLNFGPLPAVHGVYEWFMYVPEYGETIQSLPFATLGRKAVSCATRGHDIGDMILVRETMHQRLARHGVRSIQLAHRDYANSPYNKLASAGAEVVAHATLPEAVSQLKTALAGTSGKALISLYWAGLDTSAHLFGLASPVFDAEVTAFWAILDALLADLRTTPDTLVLLTADHGHSGLPAEQTLNINERWPQLNGCLAASTTGETIWPNGSPRDMFLHVVPHRRAEVMQLLQQELADIAEVLTVDAALSAGLFGPDPVSPKLRERLGDVLVLPHAGHFIWWREPGLIENRLHSHHGGLSAEELVTVLGVLENG